MDTKQKRTFAVIGGLFGAAYLTANQLAPGIPDFLMGVILGLTIVVLVMGLLPEETLDKIRKWKRRG